VNDSTEPEVNTPVDPPADTKALAPIAEDSVFMTKDKSEVKRIAKLAADVLDNANMLKRWCRIGKDTLAHATWKKHQLPKFADGTDQFTAKDFKKTCDDVADEIRALVAVKDVRVDLWVRCYLFVENVKKMGLDVERLSYYQVANKFLPCMSWSPSTLTGEIKPEWADWLKDNVARQLSDAPMTIRDLDVSISNHEQDLKDALDAKKTPEARIESDRKKLRAERTKKENDVRTRITTGIDEALGGVLTPSEVVGILDTLAKERKITLPNVGNPILDAAATMTEHEARALAGALNRAGNIDAMLALFGALKAHLKAIETVGAQLANVA